LQQSIFAHRHNAFAHLYRQELANHCRLMSQRLDEDVQQANLCQERRHIIADNGSQGKIDNGRVAV